MSRAAPATGETALTRAMGEILARRLAGIPIKCLAADGGVAMATAARWHAGALPRLEHFAALVTRYGRGFLEDIFQPALSVPVDPADRLDRIAAELAELRRALRQQGLGAAAPAPVDALAPLVLEVREGDHDEDHGAGAAAPAAWEAAAAQVEAEIRALRGVAA